MNAEADAAADARGQAGRRQGSAALGGHEPDAGHPEHGHPLRADRLSHRSFFSGGGGLDEGLHRAGWHTISFSENHPYSAAVFRRHFPDADDLGDITAIADPPLGGVLWSAGFPCQDLSHAGRRRGFGGDRSVLAFVFIDLVERANALGGGPDFLLLENVPGLLTSNGGRDMARLLGELADIGYGVAYRCYNAAFFGVPQRRERVFLVGVRSAPGDTDGSAAAISAATVQSLGARCSRDHLAEREARSDAAGRAGHGLATVGAFPAGVHGFPSGVQEFHQGLFLPEAVEGPQDDPDGGGETLRPAGRMDDRAGLAAWVKAGRAQTADDAETWKRGVVSPTINLFDGGDSRATVLVAPTMNSNRDGGWRMDPDQATSLVLSGDETDTGADPEGQDSNRFRVCGNAVVVNVAEWIGARLRAYVEGRL